MNCWHWLKNFVFFCILGELALNLEQTESGFLISIFISLSQWKVGWGSIIIGKNIEQLQSMSFVMSPWGLMTESEAGSCRASYWTTHLVPADAFTALRHGWPSGCAAEHQNINTAQIQHGPLGLSTRQTESAPLLMEDRPIAARKTSVNRAIGCSVAPNGRLINSRVVVVIWNDYTWDDCHQFWLREGSRWVCRGPSVGGQKNKT